MEINTFNKVEYCYENITSNGRRLIEKLNELGKEGWEFIYKENNSYFFKRVVKSSL